MICGRQWSALRPVRKTEPRAQATGCFLRGATACPASANPCERGEACLLKAANMPHDPRTNDKTDAVRPPAVTKQRSVAREIRLGATRRLRCGTLQLPSSRESSHGLSDGNWIVWKRCGELEWFIPRLYDPAEFEVNNVSLN